MTKFRKAPNIKIIAFIIAVIFLFDTTAYGIDLSSKDQLRTPLLTATPESTQRLGQGSKLVRKLKLAAAIGLPAALVIGLISNPDVFRENIEGPSGSPETIERTYESGQDIGGEENIIPLSVVKADIQETADQYNSPPEWRSFYIDMGGDAIDVSRAKSLRLRVQGEGNIVVQIMDARRIGESDWRYGASFVYRVRPGEEFIYIPISEFTASGVSLNLSAISKIVVYAGDEIYGIKISPNGSDVMVTDIQFSTDEAESTGIPIPEHLNALGEAQRRITTLREENHAAARRELSAFPEFQILSNARFKSRIDAVKKLRADLLGDSDEARSRALSLLRYALMDPAQNTNLRRFVYYILKDVAGVAMNDEALEDFVKRGPRVTDPIVAEFPMIWYQNGVDLFEYPEWGGETVMRRFIANGLEYGVEGVIISRNTIERIVDRNIMKRLAYWSIIMGIDPMKVTFPLIYTETLLGVHPDKTYNIMAIHEQNLDAALDPVRTAELTVLLRNYGGAGQDPMLDKVIVAGLLLMRDGFNRFPANGNLAFRLQGYNGYGANVFLGNKIMRDEPMIGRRAVIVGERISGSPLSNIVGEISRESGMEIPRLPANLSGYRIQRLPRGDLQGRIPDRNINNNL